MGRCSRSPASRCSPSSRRRSPGISPPPRRPRRTPEPGSDDDGAPPSFYNVVGLRVPLKKSIVRPRSHCSNCG
ncbi:prepilin peptidase, partial [Micrococcus luteus]|uniref:prepilin peptidase n=1 Tax=Micrococcus luteus TaxID=1270 RepID=UPI003410F68B